MVGGPLLKRRRRAIREIVRGIVSVTRASLFITCLNDTLFPQTGRAVVTLLERLGVAVDFAPEQTCCGQMHFNTGYAREAIPLVRRFVDAFADAEVVVSPSASVWVSVSPALSKLAVVVPVTWGAP